MKNKIILTAAFGCVALNFTACGDEVTEQIIQSNGGMESVAVIDELPDCTKDNVGEMAFVSKDANVYYCADSSWQLLNGKDGENGKDGVNGTNGIDGESCTIEELDEQNGYKIICGGDSVGVVLNGAQGPQGEKGDTGAKGDKGNTGATGAAGTSCTAEALEDKSGYKIVCGGDSVGVVLNGKQYCGKYIYDPNKNEECHEGVIFAPCGEAMINTNTEICEEGIVYGKLLDSRDNRLYKTITIGTQVWTAQNMNYASSNSYCYNNDVSNCDKYGRLYTWYDAQSACPEGYHLPNNDEWEVLIDFVIDDNNLDNANTVGTYLKSTIGWQSYSSISAGNNQYGFNGFPAGYRDSYGSYNFMGYYGYFWSSTESSSADAHYYCLRYYFEDLIRGITYKTNTGSVRCLKDLE